MPTAVRERRTMSRRIRRQRYSRRTVAVRLPVAPRVLVLAAAIPLVFLHVSFQPGVAVGPVDAYLSDFAILAVVVTALGVALRDGVARLRPGRALWIVTVAFFVWVAVEIVRGHLLASSYATTDHAVTAAKFAEYALLAPAVPLLLRTRRDVVAVLWSFTAWSVVADAVGLVQFFGARVAGGQGVAGHRQPSFLSDADFAALSSAVLLIGIVALAAPQARLRVPLAWTAVVAGALGTILAGAVASVLGLALALVLLAVVLFARRSASRRGVVLVAVVAVVTAAGVAIIRTSDLEAFARFVGTTHTQSNRPSANVQTYAHHTLLAWIGYRVWREHPLLGVGWQGVAEPAHFMPVLPAAHRRFPTVARRAFPAPDRRYGTQDVWVEALADLGVLGFALWAAIFVVGTWIALAGWPALLAVGWLPLLAGLWSSQGFVAGIPLDGLMWIGAGLAATRLVEP